MSRSKLVLALLTLSAVVPLAAADRGFAIPSTKLNRARKPQVVADPSRDAIYPYVYDGAGWSTSFVFTNLDNHTININLEFSNDDGSNLLVPLVGVGTDSSFAVTIPYAGTVSLATGDTSSILAIGYAFAGAANQKDLFSGYAVVRNQTPGLPDLEFTIPITPINENQFVLPFDNTNGYLTRAVLINSSLQNNATVNVTVNDQDGNVLATDQIAIVPLGAVRFSVTARYPQLQGIVGSIFFSAPSNQFVTGLGERSGPNLSLTAIPPFSLRTQ